MLSCSRNSKLLLLLISSPLLQQSIRREITTKTNSKGQKEQPGWKQWWWLPNYSAVCGLPSFSISQVWGSLPRSLRAKWVLIAPVSCMGEMKGEAWKYWMPRPKSPGKFELIKFTWITIKIWVKYASKAEHECTYTVFQIRLCECSFSLLKPLTGVDINVVVNTERN